VSCAKTAEPIEMSFGTRTRLGARKHVFVKGAHWRHLVKTIEPVIVTVGLPTVLTNGLCIYSAVILNLRGAVARRQLLTYLITYLLAIVLVLFAVNKVFMASRRRLLFTASARVVKPLDAERQRH